MSAGSTVGGSESIDRFINSFATCSYVTLVGAVKGLIIALCN